MIIHGLSRVVVGILCLVILAVIVEQVFGVDVASIFAEWADLARTVASMF